MDPDAPPPARPISFRTRFPRGWLRETAESAERALDILLAPLCLHCDRSARGPWWPHLCERCAADLIVPDVGHASGLPVHAPLLHEGPARTLLHALKYRGATRVGRRLGRAMASAAPDEVRDARPGTLLVGVPLHWVRRRRRGHDQTRALVAGLRVAAPWLRSPPVLRRARRTRSQVGLGSAERRRNVRGVFVVRDPHPVAGRDVLLVDDVVTTGATVAAAAEALRACGARVRAVLAAARAGDPSDGSVDPPDRDDRAA